jgi:hypothetical protein
MTLDDPACDVAKWLVSMQETPTTSRWPRRTSFDYLLNLEENGNSSPEYLQLFLAPLIL